MNEKVFFMEVVILDWTFEILLEKFSGRRGVYVCNFEYSRIVSSTFTVLHVMMLY